MGSHSTNGHDYKDAIIALNSLQSNFATINAAQEVGAQHNEAIKLDMRNWCRRMGYEPQELDKLNNIHVAGTKGKGSTSAFISSILAQYSPSKSKDPKLRKVGLYTSPHLRSVCERIRINNEPISEEKFTEYFFETWSRMDEGLQREGLHDQAKPAYFRYLTLMALHTYISEGVDTAVIETGIGGELDCTNVLVHPVVTGITSLGIDHVKLLGEKIEEIAWHKGGIMKPGSLAFTVPQPSGAMEVLRQRANEKRVELTVIGLHPALEKVKLGLAADFQKINASLAIAIAAAHLRALGHTDIPDQIWTQETIPPEFQKGLEDVRWQGRCETRREGKVTWCLDGGHTMESIALVGTWFAATVLPPIPGGSKPTRVLIFNQQRRERLDIATGLYRALTQALNDNHPFTHVFFCTNTTFRASGFKPDLISVNTDAGDVETMYVQQRLKEIWDQLEQDAGGTPLADVKVIKTIEEAVEGVRDLARAKDEQVTCLITGSVLLVGGALEVLETSKLN